MACATTRFLSLNDFESTQVSTGERSPLVDGGALQLKLSSTTL